MQSSALVALNQAWWGVFFVRRVRVVWKSNFGTSFVLGAFGARNAKWKGLARIDWLRGTVKDDKINMWWEEAFLNVPAFQELVSDSSLSIRNSRGNVVEACVGASFLAAHELAASRAPAASGATIPRFRFRTKPPEAMAHAAAIFPLFVHLGVSSPALRRPDASERRSNGIPGEIKVVEPDAQAGLAAQPRADAWPPRVHWPSPADPPKPNPEPEPIGREAPPAAVCGSSASLRPRHLGSCLWRHLADTLKACCWRPGSLRQALIPDDPCSPRCWGAPSVWWGGVLPRAWDAASAAVRPLGPQWRSAASA